MFIWNCLYFAFFLLLDPSAMKSCLSFNSIVRSIHLLLCKFGCLPYLCWCRIYFLSIFVSDIETLAQCSRLECVQAELEPSLHLFFDPTWWTQLKAMDNCPSEAYVIVTLIGHLFCMLLVRVTFPVSNYCVSLNLVLFFAASFCGQTAASVLGEFLGYTYSLGFFSFVWKLPKSGPTLCVCWHVALCFTSKYQLA